MCLLFFSPRDDKVMKTTIWFVVNVSWAMNVSEKLDFVLGFGQSS